MKSITASKYLRRETT